MVYPILSRFAALPFPQRKTAEKRRDYFLKEGPRADWQRFKTTFSRPGVSTRPPLFEFDREGKVWLKGEERNRPRPKEASKLDRIFQAFLSAPKPGLAALTVVLGMEWELPDRKGTRLAKREDIFTTWLKQLDGEARGGLAGEGFAVTPELVFQLASGQLTLQIENSGRYGGMFTATRGLASVRFKKPERMNFDGIDPFFVSELSAYYFADAGLAALEKRDPEAALAAFRLAEVITPGHTVIGKLMPKK